MLVAAYEKKNRGGGVGGLNEGMYSQRGEAALG